MLQRKPRWCLAPYTKPRSAGLTQQYATSAGSGAHSTALLFFVNTFFQSLRSAVRGTRGMTFLRYNLRHRHCCYRPSFNKQVSVPTVGRFRGMGDVFLTSDRMVFCASQPHKAQNGELPRPCAAGSRQGKSPQRAPLSLAVYALVCAIICALLRCGYNHRSFHMFRNPKPGERDVVENSKTIDQRRYHKSCLQIRNESDIIFCGVLTQRVLRYDHVSRSS